jgi:phosphocarrier protein HPr
MIRKKFTVVNKLGLHARASAKLVDHAARYGSKIWIVRGERKVNGKSIMGVMMLAASKGTEIELIISGDDENDALNSLGALIENKFGESE